MKTSLWLFAVALGLSACEGGGCGPEKEVEQAKTCPAGATWNADRKVCLDSTGAPRASLD